MSKTYVIDIDGTICDWEAGRDYTLSEPFPERIKIINDLYDDGNIIKYFTARGMGRFKGDRDKAGYELIQTWQGFVYHMTSRGSRFKDGAIRNPDGQVFMTVKKEKGKRSVTNYKTLEIFYNLNLPKISLVECQLETGRTHQIRVHMNFKGNPILGDKSYGKIKRKFKKIDANIEKKINSFNRQALHAKSLGFIHPRTEKKIFFEVESPKDFDQLVKSLKKASI